MAVLELMVIFGAPASAYAVKRYFDAVEKGRVRMPGPAPLVDTRAVAQVDELKRVNKVLDDRVKNLESIVCGLDFELNARLAKLSIQTPALQLPAPDATAPAPASLITAVQTIPSTPTPPGDARYIATLARSVPLSVELAPGSSLGARYTVERLLGRGGMGAVYLSRDSTLGEPVALKVMSGSWTMDRASAAERFRREAAAARRVTHPNVVRIHDLGEESGVLYMSMEYFQSQPLSELLTTGGMPFSQARHILLQVCQGLAAAHKAGVVHRDLKPGNVLVDAAQNVKLIDFGLARTTFLDGMTASGLILGTPEYMSPEQVRGQNVDLRSDIYSLGALAYHVLTGRPPFTGETPIAVGFAHCSTPVPPLGSVRAGVPSVLEEMVLSALAKEPSGRPGSAEIFAEALKAL